MSRVSNQVFEPKDGKVFYEQNALNLIPTLIPLTDFADPTNANDFISVSEYMIRQMDQNRTIAALSHNVDDPDYLNELNDGKLCKQCVMYEVREIESDLTILLEIDFNDILEVILENDPTLNTNVNRLCEMIKGIRELIPELVWMPFKRLANRRDLEDEMLPLSDTNRSDNPKIVKPKTIKIP